MEDVNENKKKLWIMFQDMKKAFNSVSTEGLRRVLERSNMLRKVINLLINLMKER